MIDESLGDEIKITVIATGFDSNNRLNNPSSLTFDEPKKGFLGTGNFATQPQSPPQSSLEMRRPLFNPKPAEPKVSPIIQSSPMVSASAEDSEDELEIPAFIRKKMK